MLVVVGVVMIATAVVGGVLAIGALVAMIKQY